MTSTRRRLRLQGFTAVFVALIWTTVPRPATAQGAAMKSHRPYFMQSNCQDTALGKGERPILVSDVGSSPNRFEALRILRKLRITSNQELPPATSFSMEEAGRTPTKEWLLPLRGKGHQTEPSGRLMVAVAASYDGAYTFYGGYAMLFDDDPGEPLAILSDRAPRGVVQEIFEGMHSVFGNQNMEGPASAGLNYRSCTPLRNWFDVTSGRSAPESKDGAATKPAGTESREYLRVPVASHEPFSCPEGSLAKSEFESDCPPRECNKDKADSSLIFEWCERDDGVWDGPYRSRRNRDLNPGQDWIVAEGAYKEDERHGQWTFWKDKVRGWKEREGEYRSGKRVGVWRKWWRWRNDGSNSEPSDMDEEDFGTGEPYVRPCTPKPVTWEQVEKATGVSSVQKRGRDWIECRKTGPSWRNEFACIERIAPMSSTWCQFAKSMCQQDDGRWRNPDDCGVNDAELAKLDTHFCPEFIAQNKGKKAAKSALRVNNPIHCAVPVRVPPGKRLLVPPPE
jgi:hypothetical protein